MAARIVKPNTDISPSPPSEEVVPEDRIPGFDQQPIEVAALADACARALDVDGRPTVDGRDHCCSQIGFSVTMTAAVLMWDPDTGGGFDGLQRCGANLNQGTESTLAFLSTMQHARRTATSPSNDAARVEARSALLRPHRG